MNDLKKCVHLYDLKNDSFEDKNIANSNLEIVDEMENTLQKIINDTTSKFDVEINEEETKKIEEELKKLGYM